jgi:hypothetical protein
MYFMICIRVVSHRVWHVAQLGKLLNRVSSGLKLKMRYKEETCLITKRYCHTSILVIFVLRSNCLHMFLAFFYCHHNIRLVLPHDTY